MSTLLTRMGTWQARLVINDDERTIEASFVTPESGFLPYDMRSTYVQRNDGTRESKTFSMSFLLRLLFDAIRTAEESASSMTFNEWEMFRADSERQRQRSHLHNPNDFWGFGKTALWASDIAKV